MSATQQTTDDAAPPDGGTIEEQAKRNGWRPKEEYTGPEGKWVDAATFMQRGVENPAILFDRFRTLDDRYGKLERRFSDQTGKLDQATQTMAEMAQMLRTSEERAYKRARAELLAQREAAVESGDTANFKKTDAQLAELDATAPKAAPVQTATQPQQPNQPPAEVLNWYQANPWYMADPELRQEADMIHMGLLQTRRDLTLEQNLQEVTKRVRTLRPDKFGAAPHQNGVDDDNPRRTEASAVTPSTPGGTRRNTNKRTFDTMPQAAKAQFEKWARQLEGKGKPLTKEEFATNYWSQFEDEE